MRRNSLALVLLGCALALVVLVDTSVAQRGRGGMGRGLGRGGMGPGMGAGAGAAMPRIDSLLTDLPEQELSDAERASLLHMREEEKLAHDVYVALSEVWPLRPLQNIPRSEQMHQQAVHALLERYQIEDPVAGLAPGKFATEPMQKLYEELVAKGRESQLAAIGVGLKIEELDIADLERQIAEADNNDIRVIYQNLLKGSRNHLRAFGRMLQRSGGSYEPEHLSAEVFEQIIASPQERMTLITDPEFKFVPEPATAM